MSLALTSSFGPPSAPGPAVYAPQVFEFETELWLWTGDKAAWHFVTVPAEVSDRIEERTVSDRRGFGSVRVRVTIGSSTWATSVFPDNKRGAYLLPVKKDVRRAESVDTGDRVRVHLELLDG